MLIPPKRNPPILAGRSNLCAAIAVATVVGCNGGLHGQWPIEEAVGPDSGSRDAGHEPAASEATEDSHDADGGDPIDSTDALDADSVSDGETPDTGSEQDGGADARSSSDCFDVSSSFSWLENPNLPWVFGGDDGESFIMYDSVFDGGVVKAWYTGTYVFDYGMVAKNTGDQELIWSQTVLLPAGAVLMHPGVTPGTGRPVMSVARWVPPRPGLYVVRGSFTGLSDTDLAPATTTDVHVWAAGLEAVSGFINLNGWSNGLAFYIEVSLAETDTVEFRVGLGAEGDASFDSTGLSAVICPLN